MVRRTLLLPLAASCTWIDEEAYADRLAAEDCAGDCGLVVEEALPDTTHAEMQSGTSTLLHGTLQSQPVGRVSAVGTTDRFSGGITFVTGSTGWEGGNDSDAFQLEVPATCRVSMTADWGSAAADLDFGLWTNDGSKGWTDLFSQYGPGSCLASDKPSACESSVELEPDKEYQLLVLGYLGEGEEPYEVALEWLAP